MQGRGAALQRPAQLSPANLYRALPQELRGGSVLVQTGGEAVVFTPDDMLRSEEEGGATVAPGRQGWPKIPSAGAPLSGEDYDL